MSLFLGQCYSYIIKVIRYCFFLFFPKYLYLSLLFKKKIMRIHLFLKNSIFENFKLNSALVSANHKVYAIWVIFNMKGSGTGEGWFIFIIRYLIANIPEFLAGPLASLFNESHTCLFLDQMPNMKKTKL